MSFWRRAELGARNWSKAVVCECLYVSACVCLCVNQGLESLNRCTSRLVMLHGRSDTNRAAGPTRWTCSRTFPGENYLLNFFSEQSPFPEIPQNVPRIFSPMKIPPAVSRALLPTGGLLGRIGRLNSFLKAALIFAGNVIIYQLCFRILAYKKWDQPRVPPIVFFLGGGTPFSRTNATFS